MKLRNKKTGEVVDLSEGFMHDVYCGEKIEIKPVAISNKEGYVYGSLAELNEEWEDVREEPKEYWYINGYNEPEKVNFGFPIDNMESLREIGFLFGSKEETEFAIRKLKAWKRLKDKGFRFTGWYGGSKNIDWEITSLEDETYIPRQICDDLELLFGGEE